jgi:transglutaminase-like putative cysteine protease
MGLGLVGELARLIIGTRLVKSAVDGLGEHLLSKGRVDVAELPAGRGPMKMKVKQVFSLEDRMAEIIRITNKGKLDPEIRKFVAEAINKKCGDDWCVKERDYDGEIVSVFNAVRRNVRYTGDIWSVDTFQHPVRTLELGIGDCDDMSIILGSCLMSIGYPIRFRVIQTKNSSDWSHIFILAGRPPRDPKQWVSLDATVRKPAGWHPPKSMIVKMRDFTA